MDVIAGAAALIGIIFLLVSARLQLHLLAQNGRLSIRLDHLEHRMKVESAPNASSSAQIPALRGYGDPISSSPGAPLIGMPAPGFRLPDAAGKPFGLEDLRGSAVFLLFWSSTCSHCKRIIEELSAMEDGVSARLQIVVVSTGPETLHADLTLAAPVLLDDQSQIRLSFGAPGTPSAVLVDRDGNIASTLARGGPSVLALLKRAPYIQPASRTLAQGVSALPA